MVLPVDEAAGFDERFDGAFQIGGGGFVESEFFANDAGFGRFVIGPVDEFQDGLFEFRVLHSKRYFMG